ncbi:MAG: flagellar filament capping protein FliD [Calditrichaeota bacterium]|nr:flagellar filament capping protein FliD [Calditrichota bacterium]MCB0285049.1 flagellar filament capping protein FliD [Calditrichota bacterium]MCB0299567.1 flagellar filament capping protein FliD [Calditrichota bacterium]MCB9066985.1 flagellar filament capping protein FliD [Calditrichia bacterium]
MVSGFSSGNIELLLESYRSLEREPIRQLESRKSGIDNRIKLFNDLKSKLSALSTLSKDLSYSGTTSFFGKKTASSSDEDYLTVTATSTAVATSTSVFVNQLAKADKVVSSQFTNTGTDIATGLGAGTFNFDVTVNGVATPVSVLLDGTEDNETLLGKVSSAVNNATGAGIRASIIKDSSSTSRMVFTSTETGADYEMTLSDTSGGLLSAIGINDSVAANGTTGGYVYDTSELNAIATIDGITVTSNTNTLEDVVTGLTISLKKQQEIGETPITVNAENDVEGIKEKLQEFIDAYNGVLDFIKTNTAVNTTTYERSAFSGDYSISTFKFQLRQIIATPITGLGVDDPSLLSELGITTDRNGKLSISDADSLDDLIKNNISQVEQIFNAADGISGKLETLLDGMTDGEGIITRRKQVLESQITTMNSRIKLMESSVDKKMDYYRTQFAQLQAAYAQYQSQYSYITALTQSSF